MTAQATATPQTSSRSAKFSDSPLSAGVVLLTAAVVLGYVWARVDLVATLFFLDLITGGAIVRKPVKAVLTTLWSVLELTWMASDAVRERVWVSRFIVGVMIADWGTDLFYVRRYVDRFFASDGGQQMLLALGVSPENVAVYYIVWFVTAALATFGPQLLMIEFAKLAIEHLYYAFAHKNLQSSTRWTRIADTGILAIATCVGLWVVFTTAPFG